MRRHGQKLSRLSPIIRTAGVATLVLVAAGLSSCGSRPSGETTSSIRNDYRKQHPINLAEAEHSLDVPIAAGDHGLTTATKDLIRGFGQDYKAISKGALVIAIPEGAANSRAAAALRGNVRRELMSQGVPSNRIVMGSYAAGSPEASAPIRLSFVAITAMTDECGQWPSDLFGKTMVDNSNWENFGCATQQNLAAQIANPADLVGPRAMSSIDAQRRSVVITDYRSGN